MADSGTSARFRRLDDVETLRLLAQNLGEGIYISRPDGTILDANQAFLAIFGVRTVAELGQFHAADLYADPSRRTAWLEALDRQLTVRDFEWELLRPDGERRTWHHQREHPPADLRRLCFTVRRHRVDMIAFRP